MEVRSIEVWGGMKEERSVLGGGEGERRGMNDVGGGWGDATGFSNNCWRTHSNTHTVGIVDEWI